MRTGWIAAAEITFDHEILLCVEERTTEWAGRYTGRATHADFRVDLVRAGVFIEMDSIHQT